MKMLWFIFKGLITMLFYKTNATWTIEEEEDGHLCKVSGKRSSGWDYWPRVYSPFWMVWFVLKMAFITATCGIFEIPYYVREEFTTASRYSSYGRVRDGLDPYSIKFKLWMWVSIYNRAWG